MKEKRYTTTQAAKIKSVSRQAIGIAIRNGKLRAEKVQESRGASWYITESAIKAYSPRGGNGRPFKEREKIS